MTSSTSKNEANKIRFDPDFVRTIDQLDEKFWEVIDFEKNLYLISRYGNTEEE